MITGSDPALAKQAREADEKTLLADLALRLRRLGGGYTILREYDFEGNLLWIIPPLLIETWTRMLTSNLTPAWASCNMAISHWKFDRL